MPDNIEWYTPHTVTGMGAVGAGAQSTIHDAPLRDPINNDLYAGTIVGGQVWITVDSVLQIQHPPCIYMCLVPAGMAVPPILTELQRYQAQEWMWQQTMLAPSGVQGRQFVGAFKLHTKRNFKRGDRLVLILVNRDTAVYGGAARATVDFDLYLYGDV